MAEASRLSRGPSSSPRGRGRDRAFEDAALAGGPPGGRDGAVLPVGLLGVEKRGQKGAGGQRKVGGLSQPLGGVSIAGGRAGPRRGTMSIGQAWKQLLEGPVTLSRAASFTQDRPRQANRKAVFRQCFPVWDQGLPSWCSSGCNSASIAAKGLHLDLLPDPVWFLLAAPLLPSPAPLRLTDLSSGYICPPPHRSPLYC